MEPTKVQFSVNFHVNRKNHTKFQLKSTQELRLMALKSGTKFKEKRTCGFKCDMTNLVNFNSIT